MQAPQEQRDQSEGKPFTQLNSSTVRLGASRRDTKSVFDDSMAVPRRFGCVALRVQ